MGTTPLRSAILAIVVLMSLIGAAEHVSAGIWSELGDAGQLVGTAQTTVGTGGLDAILGTLPTDLDPPPGIPPDIDLFRILITDPAAFSATTVNTTEFIDTRLYLFRTDGVGVLANDETDSLNAEFRATIPAGSLLSVAAPVGEYLLGIALFESNPVNANGDPLFPDLILSDDTVPPLVNDALADWSTLPIDEPFTDYRIDLTGADYAVSASSVVPEPTSLASWLGIFSLAACTARRRMKRRGSHA